MTDPHAWPDEEFDRLLGARAPSGDTDALRQALLDQTSRVVGRRRWRRRAGLVAALAACYLAGLLTTWLTARPVPVSRPAPEAQVTEHRPDPTPSPPTPDPGPPPADAPPFLAAAVFERMAETASPDKRPRLLLDAGAHEKAGDIQAALRCYARYLDVGSDQDRAISADEDSSLLMAMKADRSREKRDVLRND